MHSNSRSEQYCITCQQNRQTWGQDNCILCVVCKKKAKTSKAHPLLPSHQNQGEKFLLVYADKLTARSHTFTRRTEGRAKRLYASQNPEQLHEGWNEATAKENSLKTHMPPKCAH